MGKGGRRGQFFWAVALLLTLSPSARSQLPPQPVPVVPPAAAVPVAPPPAPAPLFPGVDAPPAQPPAPPQPPVGQGPFGSLGNTGTGLGSQGLGGFGNLFSPNVGQVPILAGFGTTWLPQERVRVQGTELGFVRENFSVLLPVCQDGCNDLSLTAAGHAEQFGTHGTILPTTGQPFPENLYNIRFGAIYRHLFDNNWIAGGSLSFGSASDELFHSIHEDTLAVSAFLRIPSGERNAWLFSLSYSPTSELNFPIPGVAYIYSPSDNLRVNIGLPFQVYYRPTDELAFTFSYMLLRTIHARAIYRVARPLRVYAGFDWSNESYFLADRPDTRQRFFSYDKRLSAGILYSLSPNLLLNLSTGYEFDRLYFEGVSYSDRGNNRVDVDAAPFLSFQIQTRW
jgi:hypothetical protein